jgi:hypothetical protein
MSGGGGGNGNGGGGGPPGGGDPGMSYSAPSHAPPGEQGGGGYVEPSAPEPDRGGGPHQTYQAPTPTPAPTPSPHIDEPVYAAPVYTPPPGEPGGPGYVEPTPEIETPEPKPATIMTVAGPMSYISDTQQEQVFQSPDTSRYGTHDYLGVGGLIPRLPAEMNVHSSRDEAGIRGYDQPESSSYFLSEPERTADEGNYQKLKHEQHVYGLHQDLSDQQLWDSVKESDTPIPSSGSTEYIKNADLLDKTLNLVQIQNLPYDQFGLKPPINMSELHSLSRKQDYAGVRMDPTSTLFKYSTEDQEWQLEKAGRTTQDMETADWIQPTREGSPLGILVPEHAGPIKYIMPESAVTKAGAPPSILSPEPTTATTPTNENLLRGDVDIFTGTKEVKETINPFEETSTAGQLEQTYGQKADEEWDGKQIVDTPGGEQIISTETGEVLGTATSGPMQDEMWSPAENVSSNDMSEKTNEKYDETDPNSAFYKDVDPKLAEAAAKNKYTQDIEDIYDPPDKEHFNDTQKEINTKIKEAKKDDRYDVSLTPKQSEQFQNDLNEYYGTEGVKYEEYGRAGKGTVNLSFQEHWDNAPILHPALKFSPSARFLYVIGKQAQEALTSDYGTGSYAGPGTDQGGLLGGLGKGGTLTPQGGIEVSGGEGSQSSPEATSFITTGHTPPSNSVAGNWYQSLGGTKAFNLATEYAAAKAAVQNRLGTPSTYGWLAINDSPFYNWLKTNSLDKGIL